MGRSAGLLIVPIFLCVSLALSSAQAEPTKVRVTIPVIGMNFLPLFVASDKGMFAKEGLDVEKYRAVQNTRLKIQNVDLPGLVHDEQALRVAGRRGHE